jgi:3-hydroxybutyryl-CoA dehydrogenase
LRLQGHKHNGEVYCLAKYFNNRPRTFTNKRILRPLFVDGVFAMGNFLSTVKITSCPLARADLIGLDVVLFIMEVLRCNMGEDKYRPAPLVRKMVDAGYLGRKSGRGFFSISGHL